MNMTINNEMFASYDYKLTTEKYFDRGFKTVIYIEALEKKRHVETSFFSREL